MKKKTITMKLQLNKETLRNLSLGDMKAAVGGVSARCTNWCQPTGVSECYECGTTLSGGSCPSGPPCC